MSDHLDHITLFTQFSGFKVVVLANRLACDNDLARRAHDHLVAKLCDLIHLMREALAAERRLPRDETSAHYEAAVEELCWLDEEFESRWRSNWPHALLDDLWIDWTTREVFDAQAKRWRFYDDDGPWLRDVSDAELCGLRRIIDQIAAETGVRFSASRIDYGDADTAPSSEALGRHEAPQVDGVTRR